MSLFSTPSHPGPLWRRGRAVSPGAQRLQDDWFRFRCGARPTALRRTQPSHRRAVELRRRGLLPVLFGVTFHLCGTGVRPSLRVSGLLFVSGKHEHSPLLALGLRMTMTCSSSQPLGLRVLACSAFCVSVHAGETAEVATCSSCAKQSNATINSHCAGGPTGAGTQGSTSKIANPDLVNWGDQRVVNPRLRTTSGEGNEEPLQPHMGDM